MAKLSKRTLQRLAVLRALLLWRRGAFGPLRVHKTLFFTEDNHGLERFFDFKKWHLGQFSEDIEESLNDLAIAGRMTFVCDGSSVRLMPSISGDLRRLLERVFDDNFKAWTAALREAVDTKGYLVNEQILEEAQRHASYTGSSKGEIIARSTINDAVEIDIDADDAESLSESVDPHFSRILKSQMAKARSQPFEAEDWRAIYFADEEPIAK
jgi:hypothetical protein